MNERRFKVCFFSPFHDLWLYALPLRGIMKVYRRLGLKQSTVSSLCCREMNACKNEKRKPSVKSPLPPTNWIFTSFEWMITICSKRHNGVWTLQLILSKCRSFKGTERPKIKKGCSFFCSSTCGSVYPPQSFWCESLSLWYFAPWRWNGTRQRFGLCRSKREHLQIPKQQRLFVFQKSWPGYSR